MKIRFFQVNSYNLLWFTFLITILFILVGLIYIKIKLYYFLFNYVLDKEIISINNLLNNQS
jgi:hypothetical protein